MLFNRCWGFHDLNHLTGSYETDGGSSRIKRELRRSAAGDVDLLDLLGRFETLCDRCGGSGEVALNPKSIVEPQPDCTADAVG